MLTYRGGFRQLVAQYEYAASRLGLLPMPCALAAPRTLQLQFCLRQVRRGAGSSSGLVEEVLLIAPALLPLHAHRISRSCSLAVEFGPSSLRTIMASADFSFGVDGRCRPSARIAPRPKEISQGKALILRSVAVGFTCARVRLAFGHPRPLPGYPTAPAFYPVPVRQLRA